MRLRPARHELSRIVKMDEPPAGDVAGGTMAIDPQMQYTVAGPP